MAFILVIISWEEGGSINVIEPGIDGLFDVGCYIVALIY